MIALSEKAWGQFIRQTESMNEQAEFLRCFGKLVRQGQREAISLASQSVRHHRAFEPQDARVGLVIA